MSRGEKKHLRTKRLNSPSRYLRYVCTESSSFRIPAITRNSATRETDKSTFIMKGLNRNLTRFIDQLDKISLGMQKS